MHAFETDESQQQQGKLSVGLQASRVAEGEVGYKATEKL
jgi:hypothetical protein